MAKLAESLAECTSAAGLETHLMSPTFRSFGNFVPAGGGPSLAGGGPSQAGDGQSPAGDFHRYARLDHVYTKGLISESKVLPDSTTDHRPVVTTVRAGSHGPGTKLVSLKRRNFKAIMRQDLEGALNITDWTKVYDIKDVDAVLEYVTAGIVSALNIVAPEKEIGVKKGPNLYLTREMLEAMKNRDTATGRRYRSHRNEVSRLVKRDKQNSNLLSLKKASNNPKVLWSLADQALGKDRPSLPASITGANGPTTTPMEAAEVMNKFFVDKVDDLLNKALLLRADAQATATASQPCLVAHVTATTPTSPRPRQGLSEEAPGVPEEKPDVAGVVPHVQQDTCQVPQEVGNVTQEVNDVRQEVNLTSRLLLVGCSQRVVGRLLRERGPNPPRSWALVKTSPSRALLTSFFTSSGRGRRNEDGNLLLKWAESSKKVGVSSSSSPLVSGLLRPFFLSSSNGRKLGGI
jgi:hypothetical protein